MAMDAGHIGVVIARDDGDIGRRAEPCKPASGGCELLAQADIGEVAGNDDMVGIVRPHVGEKAIEAAGGHVAGAVETPVGVADQPL